MSGEKEKVLNFGGYPVTMVLCEGCSWPDGQTLTESAKKALQMARDDQREVDPRLQVAGVRANVDTFGNVFNVEAVGVNAQV